MPHPLRDRANLFSLLRNIRLAGLDPTRWQIVLDQISADVDGICTHMFGYDSAFNDSEVAFHSGYDPVQTDLYVQHYSTSNPWAPGFSKFDAGIVIPSQLMISDEALRQTEFYTDWVLPQGDICLGGGAILEKERSRNFVIGANIRRKDGLEKQARWLALLSDILPYLRASLEVNRLLNGLKLEAHLLRRGVDLNAAAVILLDAIGRCVFCNELADSMISKGDVVKVGGFDRLEFNCRSAMQALAQIRHETPWTSNNHIALQDEGGNEIDARAIVLGDEVLEMLPFWLGGFVSMPITVLILSNAPSRSPIEEVAESLGLTIAQSEVVNALVGGKSMEEISTQRGTSLITVRNQVKAAMERTETRRQIDLVLLVDRITHGR